MREMTKEQRKEIETNIYMIMMNCTSSEYANRILEDKGKDVEGYKNTFMDDVIEDVMCASAWDDEGYYNDDDIRLAIGRIFLERLGHEV